MATSVAQAPRLYSTPRTPTGSGVGSCSNALPRRGHKPSAPTAARTTPLAASHSTHRQRGEGGRPLGNNSSRAAIRPKSTANSQLSHQTTAAAAGTAPGRVISP
jgi:hypothetical protein